MMRGGKRPRKRETLDPVTVGSRLTKRTRAPAIWDDKYRESMLRGEPIDSRVRGTTAQSFSDFETEVREFCFRTFKKARLPDPFLLIHPDERLPSEYAKVVFAIGLDHLRELSDQGYRLVADLHTPSEDHSKLWYAARLAAGLTSLDLLQAKMKAGVEPPEALLIYAAHIGVELGHLMEESKFKEKHEALVMSRLSSTAALKKSQANIDRADDAKEWHAQARLAAQRIRKRKPHLKSKYRLARIVIKELQNNDPTFDKSERTVRRVI